MVDHPPDRLLVLDNSSLAEISEQGLVQTFVRALVTRDLHALIPNETLGEFLAVKNAYMWPRVRALRELTLEAPIRVHLLEDMEELVRVEIDGHSALPTRDDTANLLRVGELTAAGVQELVQAWDDGSGEVKRSKDTAVEITRAGRESRNGSNQGLRTEGLADAIARAGTVVTRANFLVGFFGKLLNRSADDLFEMRPRCPIFQTYTELWTRQALADFVPDDEATRASPFRSSLARGRGDLFDNAIIAVSSRASILLAEDDRMLRRAERMRAFGFIPALPCTLRDFLASSASAGSKTGS